jgi:FAD binding domain
MSISNWNGSARFTPRKVEIPSGLPELRRIVTDPACPKPLRAVGELHSLNDSVVTEGTVIFMKHFDKKGEPEGPPGHQTVTVGAGVRMIDLNKHLKRRGLQLCVVPEIGNATAGSVACCGTKDSSLGPTGPGHIAATVRGVRIVDATGADVPIGPGDPRLPLIRSSYGLLGIVHEVTFAVQPRQKIKYQYVAVDLGGMIDRGESLPGLESREILGGAGGFLGFLLPYRRRLLVERRWIARFQREIPGLDWLKLKLRTFAWRTGARPFVGPLRLLPRGLRKWIVTMWIGYLERFFLGFFFLRLLRWFTTFRADAMIDFKRPVSSYFDFTFWAFPASEWGKIVPRFLEFCEQWQRRSGFRTALPTEVYFIRKDDPDRDALLSFCRDEDIFTLDLVNWTDEDPAGWREMNEAFNEFAALNGGRPLLNQTKELSSTVARMVWTKGWYALADARRMADPGERFLTPFFKKLLP